MAPRAHLHRRWPHRQTQSSGSLYLTRHLWAVLRTVSHTRRRSGAEPSGPRDEALQARCRRSSHPAPSAGCSCGIYAHRSREAALQQARRSGPGSIVGEVELWGRVVEHEHGFRAERALPIALLVPLTNDAGEARAATDALALCSALSSYGVRTGCGFVDRGGARLRRNRPDARPQTALSVDPSCHVRTMVVARAGSHSDCNQCAPLDRRYLRRRRPACRLLAPAPSHQTEAVIQIARLDGCARTTPDAAHKPQEGEHLATFAAKAKKDRTSGVLTD